MINTYIATAKYFLLRKNFSLKIVLTLFILFLSVSCAGQKIIGSIVDSENHPVDSALVELFKSSNGLSVQYQKTNAQGSFTFLQLEYTDYFLKISRSNFRDTTIKVHLNPIKNESQIINIGSPTIKELKEVIIKYQKPTFEKKIDRFIFNMQNSSLAVGNNSWDVLRQTPMLNADNDGSLSIAGVKGVTVYVNDRKINLSGDDLYQYLRTMPSENIDRIEILTVPSSKYAAGNPGGIINIVLKKNQSQGLNVIATLSDQQATLNSQVASSQITFRTPTFNALLSLNAASTNLHLQTNNQIGYLQSSEKESLITDIDIKPQNNLNTSLQLDFDLSKKSKISLLTDYRYTNTDRLSVANDNIAASNNNEVTLLSESPFNEGRHLLNNNLFYQYQTKNSKLIVSSDFLHYTSNSVSDFTSYTTDIPPALNSAVSTSNLQTINSLGSQVDYSYTITKKTQLQTGLRFSSTHNSNKFDYDQFSNGVFMNNPRYSDDFHYREKIFAMYATLQTAINKKLDAMAGIRFEQTDLNNNSDFTGAEFKTNYSNVFPSLYLDYKVNDNNDLSFAVKSDISRPTYSQLNPFTYLLGTKYFVSGNPLLRPSNALTAEITYSYTDSYIFQAGYTYSNHLIGQIPVVHRPDTIILERFNYGNSDNFHFTNVIDHVIIKGVWNLNLTNTFSYQYQNVQTATFVGATKNLMYNGNLKQTFPNVLKSKIDADVSFNINTTQKYANTKVSPYSDLNLGFVRKYPKQGIIISLYAADVLNTIKNKSFQIDSDTYQTTLHTFGDSRSIRISITKRFGNNKVKNLSKRTTENSEEINRIK
ncbi:TonB-dependent receptor [Mucilaginibacter jinjuensis]|uniref:TonB-dependent receptor n=1 Tax=Mucilaginibacter jinjuensis TaxID=1176721 RepID=A0ABY7TE69_9SPHI|nr:TonB-dependent receptor [Mucilaginibacter jinjuensis]WCT14350.1 TonB-dependent receptor [Mucilaginibacter jinjuensis]